MATMAEAPQWEPDAEAVEALAKETWTAPGTWARESWGKVPEWQRESQRAEARFILRRQHEREQILLDALYYARGYGSNHPRLFERANAALAAHAKLDAPKVPTLLEAAKAFIESTKVGLCVVNTERMNSLKAAVEWEEKK